VTLRTGVRLAIDWGTARIGVAASDASGVLAYPVATVPAGPQEVERLAALVAEYDPVEVLVGLPRRLAGDEGPAAAFVRERAGLLARRLGSAPAVRLVDERLTTVTAQRRLHSAGRNTRRQRAIIDAAAAVAILEGALDAERAQDAPPGELANPGPDASPG
jgi:putative holliday junction resolvase